MGDSSVGAVPQVGARQSGQVQPSRDFPPPPGADDGVDNVPATAAAAAVEQNPKRTKTDNARKQQRYPVLQGREGGTEQNKRKKKSDEEMQICRENVLLRR